jgi:hypothetical protein
VLLFSEWNNFVFIFILFKIKEFIVQGYPLYTGESRHSIQRSTHGQPLQI